MTPGKRALLGAALRAATCAWGRWFVEDHCRRSVPAGLQSCDPPTCVTRARMLTPRQGRELGMQKHGCVQPRERARVHVWPAAAVDATAPRALAGRFRTLSDAIGRYLRAGREGSTLMRWARARLS